MILDNTLSTGLLSLNKTLALTTEKTPALRDHAERVFAERKIKPLEDRVAINSYKLNVKNLELTTPSGIITDLSKTRVFSALLGRKIECLDVKFNNKIAFILFAGEISKKKGLYLHAYNIKENRSCGLYNIQGERDIKVKIDGFIDLTGDASTVRVYLKFQSELAPQATVELVTYNYPYMRKPLRERSVTSVTSNPFTNRSDIRLRTIMIIFSFSLAYLLFRRCSI